MPIRITDRAMSIDRLCAWAKGEAAMGAEIIIVDNMKHIRVPGFNGSRVEMFIELSARLKMLRDDIRKPVIVIHHLNKDMDLSWSDDIWRDADIVMFLERNEEHSIDDNLLTGEKGRSVVDLKVKKNRDGVANIGFVLEFLKESQIFVEFDEKMG